MRVDTTELLDSTEVAALLGLSSRNAVSTYAQRHADFPKPVVVKTRVRLWLRPDVLRWARAHESRRQH